MTASWNVDYGKIVIKSEAICYRQQCLCCVKFLTDEDVSPSIRLKVTYSDLIQIGIFIVALISLLY